MVKICQTGLLTSKLWNHTKKAHFPVFAKNFRRPCMKLKNFFCQFPNPWTLRVSGMGGYTSKCEKKSKSLHPTVHQRKFIDWKKTKLFRFRWNWDEEKKFCGIRLQISSPSPQEKSPPPPSNLFPHLFRRGGKDCVDTKMFERDER
jgi:hypothetical protein